MKIKHVRWKLKFYLDNLSTVYFHCKKTEPLQSNTLIGLMSNKLCQKACMYNPYKYVTSTQRHANQMVKHCTILSTKKIIFQ